MNLSRREFLQLSTVAASGIGVGFSLPDSDFHEYGCNDLYRLSSQLLNDWGYGMLLYQNTDQLDRTQYGSLSCPDCGIIHGRCGDAFYPLLHLADKTKDERFLKSALMLYQWMEENVSEPDGSWLNMPVNGSWKGITVFTTISLSEAVKNYGHIIDPDFRNQVIARIQKAGDYVANNFTMGFSNINYPICASYALTLAGQLLNDSHFIRKGREFAHTTIKYLTPNNKLIYGEGKPYDKLSPKGCYPVDLGYNVEESLPALVMYGLLSEDQEILEQLIEPLEAHMEFLLPDGTWDNSWGTRNFKWTVWGSRTTDGCQPAYALLADRDPRFYKVALKNTELLRKCTHEGILYGGEHLHSHGILPCIHHTFCHSKALATILDHQPEQKVEIANVELPREKVYGIKAFRDIDTYLVSIGSFRGTVTAYDREYTMKGGHATGGALSYLWHDQVGTIFTSSMGKYQLIEANNMQVDDNYDTMPLTPRIEIVADNGKIFSNIYDLSATVESFETDDNAVFLIQSKLVDINQDSPEEGKVFCQLEYIFSSDKVILKMDCNTVFERLCPQIILPVISKSEEVFNLTENSLDVSKGTTKVKILCNRTIGILPSVKSRIFNFVPGMEAIPLCIKSTSASVEILVKNKD